MASYLNPRPSRARGSSQTTKVREDQIPNAAGGFTFAVDHWEQLRRFLILGTEGGTYYVGEKFHTKQNLKALDACLAEDPERTVTILVDFSIKGRALKQDPILFALARVFASKNPRALELGYDALIQICRTGTHLLMFVSFVDQMRGWGRGLRTAVARWYGTRSRTPEDLAFQLLKYRNREGWTHRDVLRMAHPTSGSPLKERLFGYAASSFDAEKAPRLRPVTIFQAAQRCTTPAEALRILAMEGNVPREFFPTEVLNSPEVWEALLPQMPPTAMIRNLGVMASKGLLGPRSDTEALVVKKLEDQAVMQKARVHPMQLFQASAIYSNGQGFRGSKTWTPNPRVTAALDEAFYNAFAWAPPIGGRITLGLDVSGSMQGACLFGSRVSASQGAAALGLLFAKTEKDLVVVGFDTQAYVLDFAKATRLEHARRIVELGGGGTDVAVPVVHATAAKIPTDLFIIVTDSETWAGPSHPHRALERYREQMGIDSDLVVISMTATKNSVADPKDSRQLNVVGFDAGMLPVIAAFCRREVAGAEDEEVEESEA